MPTPAAPRGRRSRRSRALPGRIDRFSDLLLDGGAYVTLSPVVLSRAVLHAAGAYRCPNVRVVGRVVATNHPPHGAFRGFGAPQVIFAMERQMTRAARRLGRDPLEWRHEQRLRLGDRTATGQKLEASVGSGAVIEAVSKALERSPRAAAPPEDGRARGRGVAFWMHGAGFTGSGEDRLAGRAAVAALDDGRFEVRTSSTDIGQGALTTFAQIAGHGPRCRSRSRERGRSPHRDGAGQRAHGRVAHLHGGGARR